MNILKTQTLLSEARLRTRLWNKTWVQILAWPTYQLGSGNLVNSFKHQGLNLPILKWE